MRSVQAESFGVHLWMWRVLSLYEYGAAPSLSAVALGVAWAWILVLLNDCVALLSLFFLPWELNIFVEELLNRFTEISGVVKILVILLRKDSVTKLLDTFDHDLLHPDTVHHKEIIEKAGKNVCRYSKLMIIAAYVSVFIGLLATPLISHVFYEGELVFPLSTYDLLPDSFKEDFKYLIYLYQIVSLMSHIWYHLSIDSFTMGLMVLATAYLDILTDKLRCMTKSAALGAETGPGAAAGRVEDVSMKNLKECIQYYLEIEKFCNLLQDTFGEVFFSQMLCASFLICLTAFRFTLPADQGYYMFLMYYMMLMILKILVPCWIGTNIIFKSGKLAAAAYECDWLRQSRPFRSSLLVVEERMQKPLSITVGGTLMPLSLPVFTSIMNTAYSFFTLLRNLQSQET